MNYSEAIQYLHDLQWFGARFGLETTRQLTRRFGHPEDGLRFIHVAGTNGKGSTCAMLESIYRKSGRKVGLYTSPHLIRFGERIQIDGELIPDEALTALIAEFKRAVEVAPLPGPPTFFEAATVLALIWFQRQKCDLVIWETGLGGRLDATNVVNPLISVITNVQLDHQKWLGNTLSEIASEKSGIIKPFRPVITGCDPGEALEMVMKTAKSRSAALHVARHPDMRTEPLRDVKLPLPGLHQWQNAAVALATIDVLQPVLPVDTATIRQGLEAVRWPGRFQIVRGENDRITILDGAHNPAGAETLRAALTTIFPGQPVSLMIGAMDDKDWASMCRILAPLATSIQVVPTGSARGALVEALAHACQQANPSAQVSCRSSVEEGLKQATMEAVLVVTGSLHVVGEALSLLAPANRQTSDERSLNDWTTNSEAGRIGKAR